MVYATICGPGKDKVFGSEWEEGALALKTARTGEIVSVLRGVHVCCLAKKIGAGWKRRVRRKTHEG